ncbi:hypothetical protein GCM10028820_07460 [Tessaracoccus terricola]
MTELSIVIPTFKGPERLGTALASLAAQTADPGRFEAVVVVNGPADGYAALVEEVRGQHPQLQLRVEFLDVTGAGRARNHGVSAARGQYLTFLDDDDWLQPEFVRLGLEEVAPDRVVVLPLIDQDQETGEYETSRYGNNTKAYAGQVAPLDTLPWVLSFNACKLVPRTVALRHSYDTGLRSGEDLVYFAGYLGEDLEAIFVYGDDAHYVRQVRPGSVSRQTESFDFMVTQRLACIKHLDDLDLPEGGKADSTRQYLMRSQAQSVKRWVAANPEGRGKALTAVHDAKFKRFPDGVFNLGIAEDLAFLYAFAPASDTSAVVAAKRLVERGRVTDVISNDMGRVRNKDYQLPQLSAAVVDTHHELSCPVSFASGAALSIFAVDALLVAEREHRRKGYRRVYSRALWAGSHAAAALFKLRHWSVEWTAEFSDPMRFSTDGGERPSPVVDDVVTTELRAALAARGFGGLTIPSTFALVEAVAMVLADELLFTNSNQMRVMLERWDDPDLSRLVEGKALISPHPQPRPTAYTSHRSQGELPDGVVNIGYFGNFYPNRGLGPVLEALDALDESLRARIHLHVFTGDVAGTDKSLASRPSSANVTVAPYLPYFEFLNMTTRLDVLLVADTVVGDAMSVNPYLPSKVSDYRGSGRPIWALVEPGSPMSELDFDFESVADDEDSIAATVAQIVARLG